MARADALLHRRGGLAGALSGGAARCISRRSRTCRRPGATTRSPRNGARCAPCAASSPARSRSSARQSASAPRSRPHPIVYVADPGPVRGRWSTSISPRSASPRRRRWSRARGRPTAFRLPTCPASPSCRNRAEGTKCARSWKISPAVGADPQYPDVTPRDAQALREWEDHAQGGGVGGRRGGRSARASADRSYVWGPLTAFGLVVAAVACVARPGRKALAAATSSISPAAAPSPVTPFARPRADLEHRHQLRPVPAGGAGRPMGAAGPQGGGGGAALGMAGAGAGRG